MKRYGLIGRELGHSFSRDYFEQKFARLGLTGHHYQNCELESIDEFPRLVQEHSDWKGWNVTIPYKESILPYLDRLTPDAQTIGAVNTIRVEPDGTLTGHNTDHLGFDRSIVPFLEPGDTKALILGTGGASRAVAHVFNRRGIKYRYVSRRVKPGNMSYAEIDREVMQHVHIIVNTTPLGMALNIEACPPIPMEHIDKSHFLIDLIYNPPVSVFLKQGSDAGARTLNGLSMLHEQAEASFMWWQE